MKKLTVVTLVLILFLTSCSKAIRVNENLYGEGEHWSVSFNIRGWTRTKRASNNTDSYGYTSDGYCNIQMHYKGNQDDLNGITKFAVDILGDSKPTIESDDPFDLRPMLTKNMIPSGPMIVHFYYNDEYSITIEWDGEISGEETIILNPVFSGK